MRGHLSDHITRIPAFNPGPFTGKGNNTYLVAGTVPTLIDAGVGHQRHLAALADALRRQGKSLSRVLVTHGHHDHAAGVEAIAEIWPRAEFLKMPWPGVDDKFAVKWLTLSDGDVVQAGDFKFRVVHSPGHAPDHICFLHEASRIMLCGDLVIKGGAVMIPVSNGGSLRNYLASLHHVADMSPSQLLPGHGPIIDDPPRVLREYLDHRRQREDQIVKALKEGRCTTEAIANRVYETLERDLRRAAEDTVLAHLIKLREEKRIVQLDQDRWELT
mgnify:CR=1 FL=1